MRIDILTLIFCGLLFTNCTKQNDPAPLPDSVKPTITVIGETDMNIDLGKSTADPGARAMDDVDGDISSGISSDWKTAVDQSMAGTYTVTYSVSDRAGNQSAALRRVRVRIVSASIAGMYQTWMSRTSGTTGPFTSTITPGESDGEIILYEVNGFFLHASINGGLPDQITFNDYFNGTSVSGGGSISEDARNISIHGTYSNPAVTFTFTETLKKI